MDLSCLFIVAVVSSVTILGANSQARMVSRVCFCEGQQHKLLCADGYVNVDNATLWLTAENKCKNDGCDKISSDMNDEPLKLCMDECPDEVTLCKVQFPQQEYRNVQYKCDGKQSCTFDMSTDPSKLFQLCEPEMFYSEITYTCIQGKPAGQIDGNGQSESSSGNDVNPALIVAPVVCVIIIIVAVVIAAVTVHKRRAQLRDKNEQPDHGMSAYESVVKQTTPENEYATIATDTSTLQLANGNPNDVGYSSIASKNNSEDTYSHKRAISSSEDSLHAYNQVVDAKDEYNRLDLRTTSSTDQQGTGYSHLKDVKMENAPKEGDYSHIGMNVQSLIADDVK